MATDRDDVYDRPLAYEDDDGRIVYRASALGGCDGALVRARLGVTGALPNDFMQTRFDEGTDWEARVLEEGLSALDSGMGDWLATQDRGILELHGRVVEAAGDVLQVETEVAWGNKVVRCHPDGILVDRESLRQAVCEVKFLGPDMAREKIAGIKKDGLRGLGDSYAWQAAIEMLSTGAPMLYIIGEKEIGETGAGDRVVTGIKNVDVFWFDVDEAPYTLKDVKARVLSIEGHVTRGTMPACPVPLMYPCPYWAEHEKVDKEEITDFEMVELLKAHSRNAGRREAMDTEMAEIRKSIEARMKKIGSAGGRCAGWDVTVMPPRPGNVSWGKAYKALAKMAKMSVDEDDYRGAEVAGGVRIGKVKDAGGDES